MEMIQSKEDPHCFYEAINLNQWKEKENPGHRIRFNEKSIESDV